MDINNEYGKRIHITNPLKNLFRKGYITTNMSMGLSKELNRKGLLK